MATWNYRVIQTTDTDGEALFSIHEVYYDSEGKPQSYAVPPANLGNWSTISDFSDLFDKCREALAKPVLTVNDFTFDFEDENGW